VAITSVGQGYESTEGCHDYKTSTETTYGGRGQPMDIGRSNNNFKDGKPKCFNCNKYRHMAKDCKGKQTMKNRKVKEDLDNEDNKKEEGFGDDLK